MQSTDDRQGRMPGFGPGKLEKNEWGYSRRACCNTVGKGASPKEDDLKGSPSRNQYPLKSHGHFKSGGHLSECATLLS